MEDNERVGQRRKKCERIQITSIKTFLSKAGASCIQNREVRTGGEEENF
jgi:hypothetical protein